MSKFNRTIDTIDKNITNGVKNGVLHLVAENTRSAGNEVVLGGKEMISFGSYSYLGLEHHPELKRGAQQATEHFGTQFGHSRAYISIGLYDELEYLLSTMFEANVLVAPSTTLAHQAVLPVLVEDNDVILIDQQVHASVQTTVKMVRDRGVAVELVRHNRIDRIEERINELKKKYNRIWYMPDGVYSMYGDYAPIKDLQTLMNRHEQFHVYVDDAHGMSWTGKNGTGYVLSQIDLHDQMILVTSLNKAFGAAGGAIVLPRAEWARKIRTCGGTLIFSTPIQPPMLGVGVASARIHLTDEITQLQNQLRYRIALTHNKIREYGLPEISGTDSPIFYVPTSLPKVSYNLVKRMMGEGFHMSPALFPAVSMTRSGIRFCVNVNHKEEDIESMLSAMAFHYPIALSEEGVKEDRVYRTFGLEKPEMPDENEVQPEKDKMYVEVARSIHQLDGEEWDRLLGGNGSFDKNGLAFLERTFTGNPEKENNWDFYYFIIRDSNHKPVLATFFTKCVCKDDIFKPAEISKQLEQIRQADKYYMTTESLMMGSLLTEGEHLFVDRENSMWKDAVLMLFDHVSELKSQTKTNAVYLRDFDAGDREIQDLLVGNGFIEVELPDYAHVSTHLGWKNRDEFLEPLGSKKRQQLRRDTFKYEDKYDVVVKSRTSEEELEKLYELYQNVKSDSYIINTFELPFKAFKNMNEDPRWEMIILRLKDSEYPKEAAHDPVGVVFAYHSDQAYIPLLVGLDYRYKFTHKNYKQAVWQVVKRANDLGAEKLYFGITATVEKQRVGARPLAKVSYVQIEDSFNMEKLELANVASLEMA